MNPDRPWVTIRLPEDLRLKLMEATEVLEIMGLAGNFLEALEAMCADTLNTFQEMLESARKRADTQYKVNSLDVKVATGWRCLFPGCGTSRNLTIHHMVPRSCHDKDLFPGDIDSPENLAPLCLAHHELVQPKWRKHLLILQQAKEKAEQEVKEQGFRCRPGK